jgi:Ti-type conjugative transfer relaxase TraA
MLEMVKINGVDYYATLAKTEYYAKENEKGEPAGKWGKGVDLIGLKVGEEVNGLTLQNVMTGFKPNGEKLQKNAGEKDYRVGMDLVFSAPKSVSILWANADLNLKNEISKFQAEAVAEAMEYLREHTEARRGKAGALKETPKALIFATFEHCESRAKDPQLHTHTVVSNACIREDGTSGAIDQNGLYVHKMAAGAIYRKKLAEKLRGKGFSLEEDPKNEGIFRVAGIPPELEIFFSKRSEIIKAEALKTGLTTAAGKKALAKSTRQEKGETDREELFEKWQNESKVRGFDCHSIENLMSQKKHIFQLPTVSNIIERLTDKESIFRVKDLDKILAEFGQYQEIDIQKMKAEIFEDKHCQKRIFGNAGEVVYTSAALAKIEEDIIVSAVSRQKENSHFLIDDLVNKTIQNYEKEQGFTLRTEQREAIEHMTKSGGLTLVRGLAGTGKTTVLNPTVEAFKSAGFEVEGATISAKAAQVLSDETGLKGNTIAKLLLDLSSGDKTLTSKTVLILDEAGMIGSRDFGKLQAYADKAGAKIIAVGDERQLQAVSSGGIFEALQTVGGIQTADLKHITRQRSEEERKAGLLFYEGKADEALKIYENRGAIVTKHSRPVLLETMAKDYAQDPTITAKKMAITATNAEAVALNEEIRKHLKKSGEIDKTGIFFENADGIEVEFSKGDRVLFKQNSKIFQVKNNQQGKILEVKKWGQGARLLIELENGKKQHISTDEYSNLRHAYAVTTHASQGATVEKAFYLFNRGADLSQGYVGMTRHKDSVKIYATHADKETMAENLSRQNFKGTTLDLGFFGVNMTPPPQIEGQFLAVTNTSKAQKREVVNLSKNRGQELEM